MAPVVALAVMLAGIAAAFWPMLVVLHLTWIDKYGAHSHGYLVLALCIWFAVRAWRKLVSARACARRVSSKARDVHK